MSLSFTSNFDQFARDLDRGARRFVDEAREADSEWANDVLLEAQSRTPVLSGELRDSGQASTVAVAASFSVVEIAFTAPHAVFIHFAVDRQFQSGEALFLERAAQAKRDDRAAYVQRRWRRIT